MIRVWRSRWLTFGFALVGMVLALLLGAGHPRGLSPIVAQSVTTQRFSALEPDAIATQVYERYPEFPLENQYVRRKTGKVAADSTLISRFIQYHTLVKGRSPKFRLDWKTSLADYLGVNEYLRDTTYPGKAFLKENPMERDRTLIRSFNRAQRATLVQALSDLYNGRSLTAADQAADPSVATDAPVKDTQPVLQPLPDKGAADLLR